MNVQISVYYLFQLHQEKVSFSKPKEFTLTTPEKYIMKRKYGMYYKHSKQIAENSLSKAFTADILRTNSSCPRYWELRWCNLAL